MNLFLRSFFSKDILLPSADLSKKGWCQLQAKVCTRITGSLPRKKVWLGEVQHWPSLMTNAVDWDVNQQNKKKNIQKH